MPGSSFQCVCSGLPSWCVGSVAVVIHSSMVVVCRNGLPFLWICPVGAMVLSPYKNEQEVKMGQSVHKVKAHTAG